MFLISKDYWEIKETTHKGRGVFAKQIIDPGIVLGDFLGKILPPEQDIFEGPFYSMHYNDNAIIMPDATEDGIHLVNHSCMPNCEIYPYKQHVILFALRKIFPGEELTFNYFIDPPTDGKEPTQMYPCNCGSMLCHGTMNTTVTLKKKIETFTETIEKNEYDTQLQVPYGEKLSPLASYPKIVEDNLIFDIFGSTLYEPLSQHEHKIPSIKFIRKHIRESGQMLDFTLLNIVVIGIMDELLVSKIGNE